MEEVQTVQPPELPMDSGTRFSSLPVSLRLGIFQLLDWKTSRKARLVCADWCHLMDYLKPPRFAIRGEWDKYAIGPNDTAGVAGGVLQKLQCLKESNYEKIATLEIRRLRIPLRIISSTRMSLPRANMLQVGESNSEQNVLKLVRYYAPTVNALYLESVCLAQIKPCLLTNTIIWNRMTRLKIKFDLESDHGARYNGSSWHLQEEMGICTHLTTLGVLLASLRIPNLAQFELRMDAWSLRESEEGLPLMSLVSPLKKLGVGLEKFLSIHGSRLVDFSLMVPCTDILNCCKHTATGRLKSLSVSYEVDHSEAFDAVYGLRIDPHLALGCFKNLVHLHLCPGPLEEEDNFQLEHENTHHAVTALILGNNKHTLKSFNYRSHTVFSIPMFPGLSPISIHHFHRFSWLVPDLKLKRLELVTFDFGQLSHNSPKLEYVTDFKLDIAYEDYLEDALHPDEDGDNGHDPPDIDWSLPAFNWIAKTMPALRTLTVSVIFRTPAGGAVRWLIEQLTSLREIKLQFGYGRTPRNFNGVSKPVMDWIASMQGRVKWSTTRIEFFIKEYTIRIQRN